MTKVNINRLQLLNFKGIEEKVILLGESTRISGDNGTGKSTLYDAAYWCLFGKDAQDRKDYCIIPIDAQGKEVHGLKTSVMMSLVILKDGVAQQATLTREYTESVQIQPDGTRKVTGHVTSCYVNGEPRKLSEYNAEVMELIGNSNDYKAISNPLYFCMKMPWAERRELILNMEGGLMSDDMLCKSHPEFEWLLQEANGRSLEQLRTDIVSRRNRTKKELDEIDVKISTTEKCMPAEQDWSGIEAELQKAESILKELDLQAQDAAKMNAAVQEDINTTRGKLMQLRNKQTEVLMQASIKANEAYVEANKGVATLQQEIAAVDVQIATQEANINSLSQQLNLYSTQAEEFDKQVAKLRNDWQEENAKTYQGDTKCPVCGQPMPAVMIGEAKMRFEEDKKNRLDNIVATGKKLVAEKNEIDAKVAQLRDKRAEANQAVAELRNKKASLQDVLDTTPTLSKTEVVKEELPEWQQLEQEAYMLERSLQDMSAPATDDTLVAQKDAQVQKIKSLQAQLSIREYRNDLVKSVEELKQQEQTAVDTIAHCQKVEDAIKAFVGMKVEVLEQLINSGFENVKFRLFDFTLDGTPKECCTPLINGVPFEAANKAAQINAGIEVINVLSKHLGWCVPIWIDNAESNNHILASESQQIALFVSNDKELVITQ